MRVHIGPYINWFGPFQLAELLKHFGVSEDKCFNIGCKLDDTLVGDILRFIHDKRRRKIKIDIDSYDTWSMDKTLALIILPMLKQLKETKHGSCNDMPAFEQSSLSGRQLCFDFYSDGDDEAWQTGHDQWDAVLGKMIWSFQQLVEDDEQQFWTKEPGFVEDGKHFFSGTFDEKGYQAYQARVREGLELFGKYYQALWD